MIDNLQISACHHSTALALAKLLLEKETVGQVGIHLSRRFDAGRSAKNRLDLRQAHANLNLGYDVASGSGKTDVPAYAAQNFLDSGQHNQYSNRISNKVGEFYLNYNKDLKGISSNINATAGYGYYNNLSINYNYPNLRANGDTINCISVRHRQAARRPVTKAVGVRIQQKDRTERTAG